MKTSTLFWTAIGLIVVLLGGLFSGNFLTFMNSFLLMNSILLLVLLLDGAARDVEKPPHMFPFALVSYFGVILLIVFAFHKFVWDKYIKPVVNKINDKINK